MNLRITQPGFLLQNVVSVCISLYRILLAFNELDAVIMNSGVTIQNKDDR